MKCIDIIASHISEMGNKFSIQPIDTGCEIFTPYVDPDNDPLAIFVEPFDGKFRISDQSRTMEFLFLHGLDIRPNSKQDSFIKVTRNRFDINFNGSEFYVVSDFEELSDAIIRLLECIRSIHHLVLTTKTRSHLSFQDDVSTWLLENSISHIRNERKLGVSNKPIPIDIIISIASTERYFMYTLHSETSHYAKTGLIPRTLMYADQLKSRYSDIEIICLLDDTTDEDVWTDGYPFLKRKIEHVDYWDDRNNLIELFH